jgi:Rrf2 family protein
VQQILRCLRLAGIIGCERGPKGGYYLLSPPDKVTLASIIAATEDDDIGLARCLKYPHICQRHATCNARKAWLKVQKTMDGVLEAISLADML